MIMPKEPQNDAVPEVDEISKEPGNWESDQKNREYYYDDSHGYETYVPELEDEQSTDDDTESNEKGTPLG